MSFTMSGMEDGYSYNRFDLAEKKDEKKKECDCKKDPCECDKKKSARWQDSDGDGKWYEEGEDVAVSEARKDPISMALETDKKLMKIHDQDDKKKKEEEDVKKEGYIPRTPELQKKVDRQIGRAADKEAIESGKRERDRDDKKVDKLYNRQIAMRFGKKMKKEDYGYSEVYEAKKESDQDGPKPTNKQAVGAQKNIRQNLNLAKHDEDKNKLAFEKARAKAWGMKEEKKESERSDAMPAGDVGHDIHKRAVAQYNKQNPSKKVKEEVESIFSDEELESLSTHLGEDVAAQMKASQEYFKKRNARSPEEKEAEEKAHAKSRAERGAMHKKPDPYKARAGESD